MSSNLALSERDRRLVIAAAILAAAWSIGLIAEVLRLGTALDESDASTSLVISLVLSVMARVPALAAIAFGLAAFRGAGVVRRRRSQQAFLLAFAYFGLDFVSRVLDFASLEPFGPRSFKVGVAAGFIGAFWLAGASLASASAFSVTSDLEARETRLRLAGFMAAAGFLLDAISAFELAVAYATYPVHNDFAGGLVIQGLGGVAAAMALLVVAIAFRRQATDPVRGTAAAETREHRLFIAAAIFALSAIVLAVGEATATTGRFGSSASTISARSRAESPPDLNDQSARGVMRKTETTSAWWESGWAT